MNRDFGLNGPGKGDADRTTNRKAFEKNLSEIPFNPADKTGFKKVSEGRFRKKYGTPDPMPSAPSESDAVTPLKTAQRIARGAITGSSAGSSDH